MEAAWNEALARFGPGGMVCGFTTGLTLLLVGAFAFLDATKPTITWRYRIQQRLAPPEHMRLGVQLFLFNLFAIHTPSTLAFPAEAMGIETAAPFPSPAAIALQIALCFVLNDFTAYWLHWLEHKIPFLCPWSHPAPARDTPGHSKCRAGLTPASRRAAQTNTRTRSTTR